MALVATLAVAQANLNFERVDRHALAATSAHERSLDVLARYLCQSGYTERQKARSIFRWVADRIGYDIDALRRGEMPSQEPAEVLRSRKAVCAGYSKLFQALAERGGLKAVYISGESKFNDQLPFKLPKNASGHAWNAVLISGQWQLLDVTWASGDVKELTFHKDYDDFWFCPPADQFVFTHLPHEPKWQLMSRPWDSQRFQNIPLLRPEFFRLGLKPTGLETQPLEVRQELVLRWPAPGDAVGISDLRSSDRQSLGEWTFSQSPAGFLETRVRCPKAGFYTLHVFGSRRRPAWQGNLQNPDRYPGIAQFTVACNRPAACPFPKTFGSFQRAGAELLEPFDGRLPAYSFQRFRVRVPGAESVVAFGGKELLGELKLRGGVYEGTMHMPAKGVPVQLCARYAQEKRYWGLVEYELQ